MRAKRIDLIEQYIYEYKSVSLDKLCEKFQVSKNTIRRDINYLTEKGVIKKVYGGVTVNESSTISDLVSFEARHLTNIDEKNKIAKLAAEYVCDGDTIFIDSGTTPLNMIDALKDKKNLTIITYSIQIVIKAMQYPDITVISLPGVLKRPTYSFIGSGSFEYLQTFNINKAFMSCTGLSVENGICNASAEEYDIKKTAVSKSQTIYLLADHSKFNKVALMTFCDLENIHCIITDQVPSANFVDFCEYNSIELRIID